MLAVAELITFPDVEDLVRGYLADTLSISAYAGTTPTAFPAQSVAIVRTGGVARDLVTDLATISIDCRAKSSETVALGIARQVRAHLGAVEREGVIGTTPVYEVREISGPYLNPDPRNPAVHRYTVAFQVAVRGSVS